MGNRESFRKVEELLTVQKGINGKLLSLLSNYLEKDGWIIIFPEEAKPDGAMRIQLLEAAKKLLKF